MMKLQTKKGYDFFLATSAMQKAVRRGDAKLAGYFAIELFESGYKEYVWLRLLTISAEDCWGILTQEIKSLFDAWKFADGKKKHARIFVAKAVILLCEAKKSRDADHLTNLVYDRDAVDENEMMKLFDDCKKHPEPIPPYAYDVHTKQGRIMGKTKAQFFKEEFNALQPRQKGLFDDLV